MLACISTPNPLISGALNLAEHQHKISKTEMSGTASSANGHGEVDLELRNQCFNKLKEKAAPGVLFERKFLEESCWGGTCSAQVLNFASLFFSRRYENLDIKDRFKAICKECEVSSYELRTQQAALNAITEDTSDPAQDFERAKIESIVALNDFTVVHASEPIPGNEEGLISLEKFKETVIKLPEGLYFTRLLATNNNHKKEAFGHSVLFLNSQEGCYFWDPMGNNYQLADKEVIEQLYQLIGGTSSRWGLENPRFYKIIPTALLEAQTFLTNRVHTMVNKGVDFLRRGGQL